MAVFDDILDVSFLKQRARFYFVKRTFLKNSFLIGMIVSFDNIHLLFDLFDEFFYFVFFNIDNNDKSENIFNFRLRCGQTFNINVAF